MLDQTTTKIGKVAGVLRKVAEQSGVVRDFVTALTQDLFHRYRPELTGELHTRIVSGGLQLTGQNVRLDLKRRDTGAAVSSLDIPVSLAIKISTRGEGALPPKATGAACDPSDASS